MEDSAASAFPDWTDLPQSAVHLISQKIKCITDYVRFCAVCSPWRAAASLSKPHHLPLQLPWLMIPYSISRSTADDGFRLFYDFWEAKIRKIQLPETIGKACCATYRGWLLLVASGGSELFLLNPLTRARVQLPPFNIPVKHTWDVDEDDKPRMADYLFNRSKLAIYSINKITFSTYLTDPNCVIMVFLQKAKGMFYCKVGDLYWTQLGYVALLEDAAYDNGSFYLYSEGELAIYNLNQHKWQGIYNFKPELQSLPKFFLVGKSGVYMVVVHPNEEEYKGGEDPSEVIGKPLKRKIDLYQVIGQEGEMDVKQVADTSETALFYGDDNHHYLAVCTDDWDSLDGGCMYIEYVCMYNEVMFNLIEHTHWKEHEECYGIFFAKMDDRNNEPVVVGLNKMPQFWPCPPSMWFQPNFL